MNVKKERELLELRDAVRQLDTRLAETRLVSMRRAAEHEKFRAALEAILHTAIAHDARKIAEEALR